MKGPVTQSWCHHITFMQQTVLLTAVRGPDGIPKYHPCKFLLRWFRRCTLVSSLDGFVLARPDQPGGGSFMGPSFEASIAAADEFDGDWTAIMHSQVSDYLRALDEFPQARRLARSHRAADGRRLPRAAGPPYPAGLGVMG